MLKYWWLVWNSIFYYSMSGIPNWYAVKLVAQMLFRRGRYVNFSEYKKVRGYIIRRGEKRERW